MEIETLLAFVGAGAIVLLSWLTRRFVPRNYFALAEIIYGMGYTITGRGIFIKFLVPTLVGIPLGMIPTTNPPFLSSSAAFLGALLLVWPALIRPELISPVVIRRRRQLYAVYLMFVLTYTVLGLSGGYLGGFIHSWVLAARINWGWLAYGVVGNLVASPIIRLFWSLFPRVYR